MNRAISILIVAAALVLAPAGLAAGATTTAAAEEHFLAHGVPGGVFARFGHTSYGPIQSATCRGDGNPSYGGNGPPLYSRFVCALRVGNDDRLLILRSFNDGRFELLGWR